MPHRENSNNNPTQGQGIIRNDLFAFFRRGDIMDGVQLLNNREDVNLNNRQYVNDNNPQRGRRERNNSKDERAPKRQRRG